MAFTLSEKSLTKENILKRLDSYQLFKAYCPSFSELDKMFKSEFREENNPSCHIIIWEGDLLYKDFGGKGYRVFDYIGRKLETDFQNTLKTINKDFNLGLGVTQASVETSTSKFKVEKSGFDVKQYKRKPTIIKVQPRRWTDLDRKYWSQYQIPPLLLKYHKIYSISGYRIESEYKDNVFYRTGPYSIAYSIDYYWHEGIFRRKLYFPFAKGRNRFVSNVNTTIVQGWTLLPKNGSNILFVTKSYKDILIFNLLGYWAIAPNSEHTFIPDEVMEKIKIRFPNIYIWFDNDEGGIKGAKSFGERFKLLSTHNPIGEPKDPSDYVKEYNLVKFDKLVTEFLKSGIQTNINYNS